MTEKDDLERLRDEVYRRVDEWIDARRYFEDAKASGDSDKIIAANAAALYEAARDVAELVLGDELRRRMWREIEPYDDLGQDDRTRQRRALLMIRQFLVDVSPLSVPQVIKLVIDAADRKLGW
jgi:hypothetical protein